MLMNSVFKICFPNAWNSLFRLSRTYFHPKLKTDNSDSLSAFILRINCNIFSPLSKAPISRGASHTDYIVILCCHPPPHTLEVLPISDCKIRESEANRAVSPRHEPLLITKNRKGKISLAIPTLSDQGATITLENDQNLYLSCPVQPATPSITGSIKSAFVNAIRVENSRAESCSNILPDHDIHNDGGIEEPCMYLKRVQCEEDIYPELKMTAIKCGSDLRGIIHEVGFDVSNIMFALIIYVPIPSNEFISLK